jgi:hypothetical protein
MLAFTLLVQKLVLFTTVRKRPSIFVTWSAWVTVALKTGRLLFSNSHSNWDRLTIGEAIAHIVQTGIRHAFFHHILSGIPWVT